MINPNLESLEEQAEREWQERREDIESHAKQILKKINEGEDMIWEAIKEWDEFLTKNDYEYSFMNKDFIQPLIEVVEELKTDIEDQQ